MGKFTVAFQRGEWEFFKGGGAIATPLLVKTARHYLENLLATTKELVALYAALVAMTGKAAAFSHQ